ncbi:MAG: hypothetical protein WC248_00300 [Candidatus Methanomethylophilaceae archaeon]|jgi:hypothetical protein
MIAPIIPILLEHSIAPNWEDAQYEWELDHIWYADKKDNMACECSHPICEVCVVKNIANGVELEIGNCCVTQLPEFRSVGSVFTALRNGRINEAVIEYADRKDIINEWEIKFLLNTYRKRKFSRKQAAIYLRLRSKIYNSIKISPEQLVKIHNLWGWDTRNGNRT